MIVIVVIDIVVIVQRGKKVNPALLWMDMDWIWTGLGWSLITNKMISTQFSSLEL